MRSLPAKPNGSEEISAKLEKPSRLLWQRVVWGAAAGLVLSMLVELLPLDVAEQGMLQWQYRLASAESLGPSPANVSNDISLVVLDDTSQYNFEITKFADRASQHVLTELVKQIEQYDPAVIVIDLDLRGARDDELVSLMQKENNIALAIFGNTDPDNELPATEPWPNIDYLEHTLHGRTQLKHEANGAVYELPISEHETPLLTGNQNQRFLALEPSLVEAVLTLNKNQTGVGPDVRSLRRGWMPLYLTARPVIFPQIKFEKALLVEELGGDQARKIAFGDSAEKLFNRKIVMIGTKLTQLADKVKYTKADDHDPHLFYQAKALETLLKGEQISTLPQPIASLIAILLGAIFGAVCAVANWRGRTIAFVVGTLLLGVGSVVAFQYMQLDFPIVAPLAILTGCYFISSFIFMDADLRVRNRELADARRSMQVRAEEERQRIAEDLHDETLPTLSAVARMADQLSDSLKDNPVPAMMRERLDFSIAEMRRVINDLHPSVLETMGFKLALENLLETCGKDSDLGTSFCDRNGFDEGQLSKETQLSLYRIVQEALNNVRKHSQAHQVEIELNTDRGRLIIAVRDDGVGITAKVARSDSHGILNIRQRAQLIGALVEWQQPKKFPSGTEVQIELPLPQTDKENG
jgi:signal transduction histidine kinase